MHRRKIEFSTIAYVRFGVKYSISDCRFFCEENFSPADHQSRSDVCVWQKMMLTSFMMSVIHVTSLQLKCATKCSSAQFGVVMGKLMELPYLSILDYMVPVLYSSAKCSRRRGVGIRHYVLCPVGWSRSCSSPHEKVLTLGKVFPKRRPYCRGG